MMPENVATRIPFQKLNSLMTSLFFSSGISRSLDMPGHAGDDDAEQADDDPERQSNGPMSWRTSATMCR